MSEPAGDAPAPRRPRAVLFDLDGTLVDSLPTIAAAMVRAMGEHGISASEEQIKPLIGPPMGLLTQEFAGISPEAAAAVADRYHDIYYDELIGTTPPCEGAGQVLERLAAAGVALGVISNKTEAGSRQMVTIEGWDRYFPVIIGADTIEAKPSPRGILHALETLGVPPGEAAMVGDTEYDMLAGRDAGLGWVIGLTHVRSAEEMQARGATHVVPDLASAGRVLLDSLDGLDGSGPAGVDEQSHRSR